MDVPLVVPNKPVQVTRLVPTQAPLNDPIEIEAVFAFCPEDVIQSLTLLVISTKPCLAGPAVVSS